MTHSENIAMQIFMECKNDFIINFNKSILNSSAYGNNLLQHWQGLNPGIADDYGFNAFCNLMFCGLMITKVLINKKINTVKNTIVKKNMNHVMKKSVLISGI